MESDISEVPWLFIVARNNRYVVEITQFISEKSKDVELLIIPGSDHATRILENYKSIAKRIAIWFTTKL
jgi:dipeptidyl aminopeptidase/acylaminoacyl peptidase